MNQHKGFTLIEMMVSLGIIMLLMTITVANYRNTNNDEDLKQAARQLVSDISLMRTYSMGIKSYESESGTTTKAYGLNFPTKFFSSIIGPLNMSNYTLFADGDGNLAYNCVNLSCIPSSTQLGLKLDSEITYRTLPKKILIFANIINLDDFSNFYDTVGASAIVNISLSFQGPDPKLYIRHVGNYGATWYNLFDQKGLMYLRVLKKISTVQAPYYKEIVVVVNRTGTTLVSPIHDINYSVSLSGNELRLNSSPAAAELLKNEK
ncbi:MAG: prepilin-type N-terminal cleavage/methylation domain-containing protein [Candidatus Falkowbacteria bacterium]